MNQKSGELGNNGTIRRFCSAYRVRIKISPSLHKIRANTRNWTRKVLQSPAPVQDLDGEGVLGSREISNGLGPGGVLVGAGRLSVSKKILPIIFFVHGEFLVLNKRRNHHYPLDLSVSGKDTPELHERKCGREKY